MNPIGINLWNWSGEFDESKIQYIERAVSLGYNAIEIGIENTDFNLKPVKDIIREKNLQVTICAALTKGRDISNFDPSIRKNTKEYMKKALNIGNELGADTFVGPLFAGGGKAHLLTKEDREKEWNYAVDGLGEIADFAKNMNMKLAIEPLNRYRTSVVNTIGQALKMVEDIGRENVGVLFDTFQANIEEKDILETCRLACKSGRLFHVQLSDSNRGAPGMGHIDFQPIFSLLKRYNYQEHITVETFAEGVFDSGWICLDTPDNVAKTGIDTINKLI